MCTFFLVVAFRDARFLSGLYGRFSYIVTDTITAAREMAGETQTDTITAARVSQQRVK